MGKQYNPYGIPILGYHGLYNNGEKTGWGWTKVEDFLLHIQYLKDKQYTPITFEELIQNYLYTPRKQWKQKKPILITFDDGYRCIYDKLFNEEITSRMKWFNGTVFLIVNKIGANSSNRFQVEGHDLLTLQEIIQMAESKNFQFGSHSLNHNSLAGLYQDNKFQEIEKELKESRDNLIKMFDEFNVKFAFTNIFAYPFGERHFFPDVINYVKKAGYVAAVDFNENPKVNNDKTTIFRLHRISMTYKEGSWSADCNNLSKLKIALFESPSA